MAESKENGDQLAQLASMTVVVADTGEIAAMKKYKPEDATTNPSLVLKALNAMDDDNKSKLIKTATDYAKSKSKILNEQVDWAMDRIACGFGLEIAKIIPGNVSTEVDAALSYDVQASVAKALRIIEIYTELGLKDPKSRILIKLASTWEGFQACKELKKHGIRCNMTLLFSIYQAAAAAQIGGAYLISPFVGRITDWFKKDRGVESIPIKEDPGVASVQNIYRYYKAFDFNTIVMGASFRSKEQILALAGCDRLTIGPKFLDQLQSSTEPITRVLDPSQKGDWSKKLDVSEPNYRKEMAFDPMAHFKLAEGIRKFSVDARKLEGILKAELSK